MISIRKLEYPDYQTIPNFFNNTRELQYSFPKIEYPIVLDELKSIIDSRFNPTVLTDDDIPIGFIDLYNIINNTECYIGNLIIHKDFRENGYASILLREIISIAINTYNPKRFKIFCWCENTSALILYKKFNFKPVELIIREFDLIKIPVLKLEMLVE